MGEEGEETTSQESLPGELKAGAGLKTLRRDGTRRRAAVCLSERLGVGNSHYPKAPISSFIGSVMPVFLNPVVSLHGQQAERRIVASTAMRRDVLAVRASPRLPWAPVEALSPTCLA